MGAHGWSTWAAFLALAGKVKADDELPPLEIQTLDVHGVRFVRLTHLIDWLEDVDGALTVAEVRETLERVGEREGA